MIITKLNYHENVGKDTYWEIKDLNFSGLNLVIGLNATGKTRLVNLISNFAKIISKKRRFSCDGSWDLEFQKNKNVKYKYKLEIINGEIVFEELKKGIKTLLKRKQEKGEIYSYASKKMMEINPPKTELTLNVRRDVKEFPFLEDLFEWADNFLGYKFTSVRPDEVLVPVSSSPQKEILENLGTTPYLLKKALNDKKIINSIINDFKSIGYPLQKVNVKSTILPGFPNPALLVSVKENDLKCEVDQTGMSQGMYRAFSLVVIIQHLLTIKKKCTVVIDNLGEGLDFQRSSGLTKILVKKLENRDIQLIMTSNDRFLINTVNLKYLNLLEREGHTVKAYNYQNSKKIFDEFKYSGLNNFDLFSGKVYKIKEE